MSSYLLEGRNMSFIANAIMDIQRNPQINHIVYPLRWRELIKGVDYFTENLKLNELKLDLYKKLMQMNYHALSERYTDNPPTEDMLIAGYETQNNWLLTNDRCKMYYTLAEVISCYLYQCSEGDTVDMELYKALTAVQSNLYRECCKRKLGEFNGWADVNDLNKEDDTID